MSSALYPTTMIPFLIPFCESASNECSNRVLFPNGIRPLGSLAVLGQSLSPRPAAKITKIVRRFPDRVRREHLKTVSAFFHLSVRTLRFGFAKFAFLASFFG